jgi:thioredoxin
MKAKILLVILVTFQLISCQKENSKAIETLESQAYLEKLNETEKPQLIDVRTPDEFAIEHLENSENMDWNSTDFVLNAEKLDKSKPVFVYCKVGGRSNQAANKLSELGFQKIYNLDGGIMKWSGKKTSANNSERIGITATDYETLIHSDKKVLVNFYAEWCGPCKKMAPYILKMQKKFKGKISIVRLDADANKSLIDEMKIDGLPLIIIYEDGKEMWRNQGYLSEEDLRKEL